VTDVAATREAEDEDEGVTDVAATRKAEDEDVTGIAATCEAKDE
jgi:hypothetical protein